MAFIEQQSESELTSARVHNNKLLRTRAKTSQPLMQQASNQIIR